jgi:protein involved in polysaccharide export with SLBB domain
MMRDLRLLAFFLLVFVAECYSQSINDSSPQSTTNPAISMDCSDPAQAGAPECAGLSQSPRGTQGGEYSPASVPGVPQLTAPPDQNVQSPPPINPSQTQRHKSTLWPETEFEQMVADSAGRVLPLFGQSLFDQPPSTFAPMNLLQVPSDYVIGPGDELQIKIWGQIGANLQVVVDRAGQIYIPQVGDISVAGVHYQNLEQHLKDAVSKFFKNFNLTANVGRLRSIQVLVVGSARYPGTYTIGSLSTLVNAIFASGGPSPQGSLRHIQVRRDGTTITDFDFYDLLVKGDKSKDVRLQPGDVLYYPHVGPLVAISGSVNTPAIYEMTATSTLENLIEVAGNLSTVADTSKITVDRITDHQSREALEFPYDEKSRTLPLKDGDIVRVLSIISRFDDTVTLRGNVANPGRYPWKSGMRVSDLIPDAQSLLTRRYWINRAANVNGRGTEYPVATEHPRMFTCLPNQQQTSGTTPGNTMSGTTATTKTNATSNNQPTDLNNSSANVPCVPVQPGPTDATASRSSDSTSPGNGQERSQAYGEASANETAERNVTEDFRHSAPEINWDYAIIQRVNPTDLSSSLLWLSPRKVILEHDPQGNLELQPGDIVTIFSQRDISVPQTERARYVIIEGEVKRPGVYKLETNDTLRAVLQRAGGLTPNAYIYGSQLTRESARIEQQKSLDEFVRNMEMQIRQTSLSIASSISGGDAQGLAQLQEGILAQLRGARATGRVALPVKPADNNLADFPDMSLEDSDRLNIPHTPSIVTVVGNVYNPGSFIFDSHTTSGKYLEMAGKGKPHSDLGHAFVLRANGIVIAANNVNGLFTGTKFDRLRLYPGDEIVVPYKLPTGAFTRGLRDWSQIASQLAITAASLSVVTR